MTAPLPPYATATGVGHLPCRLGPYSAIKKAQEDFYRHDKKDLSINLGYKIQVTGSKIMVYGMVNDNFDEVVKSLNFCNSVVPAKAGIRLFQLVLDPRFRRSDGFSTFYGFIMFNRVNVNKPMC